MATKRREAKDLSPAERKRIVEAWNYMPGSAYTTGHQYMIPRSRYCRIAGLLLNVHADTVRLVLREEEE